MRISTYSLKNSSLSVIFCSVQVTQSSCKKLKRKFNYLVQRPILVGFTYQHLMLLFEHLELVLEHLEPVIMLMELFIVQSEMIGILLIIFINQIP